MAAWLIPALIGATLGGVKSSLGKQAAKKQNLASGIANLGGERRQPVSIPSVGAGIMTGGALGAALSGLGEAVGGAAGTGSGLEVPASPNLTVAAGESINPALGDISNLSSPIEAVGRSPQSLIPAIPAGGAASGWEGMIDSATKGFEGAAGSVGNLLKDPDIMKNMAMLQAVKMMAPDQSAQQQVVQPVQQSRLDGGNEQDSIAALIAALGQYNKGGYNG